MAGPLNTWAGVLATRVQQLAPAVQVKVGPSWIRAQLPPPRIVVVPESEQFKDPDGRQGAGAIPGGANVLENRIMRVQLHLWAVALNGDGTTDDVTDDQHIDALEILIDQTCIALAKMRWGEAIGDPISGVWVQADGQILSHGVGYILLTQLQIPVIMAESTTVVMTFPTTGKMNGQTV